LRWALVTGACSGIGLARAHELAGRDYSLVLVSNRGPELQTAATRIAEEHGVAASASSWRDFPGIALYSSTKRYLRSFAAALREELRPWGVNVTCLAPGAVATNLYGQTTGPAATAAGLGILKGPARVAATAVRGMFRKRAVVLPGPSAEAVPDQVAPSHSFASSRS
jgi:short-subunit dehydrogenase